MTIGKVVAKRIQREPLPWNMQVRLGDLFIEGFEEAGLVSLYYPKRRDSSWIISVTAKWTELADIPEIVTKLRLIGSTTTKPEKITGSYQKVLSSKYPLVKGGDTGINLNASWVSALNKLQQVGWRINERVYKALNENRDLFVSDIPIEDNDVQEQKRRSKRLEWTFILGKAKLLVDENVFYQYLDCDYRGRFYYIEHFLNYQGSDVARGLMKFARGKPMTEEGMQWLAIHTASSFNMSYKIDEIPDWCTADYKSYLKDEGLEDISVDKMTLEDRIEWCNQFMPEILDAGYQCAFTTDAEKPVSFLACCIEWADISDAQKDNRIHMSHLPIPIDGSNNGWQHLAAISKDPQAGELVGLTPVEIQKDFYVQTAKKMIEINTDPELADLFHRMPMKKIRKGISKRGSMTKAYSAGATKIAENMYADCKQENYHTEFGITEEHCLKLAHLLTDAVAQVCPGPLRTMHYLQELAGFEIGKFARFNAAGEKDDIGYKQTEQARVALYRLKDPTDEELAELDRLTKLVDSYHIERIYGNGAEKLGWDTPSGFHVNYVNWITRSARCLGSIGKRRINHVAQIATDKPDYRGFMCGISPNFIHSMDASHMALVVHNWNGDFGAVHDSFSTHACDVDDLLMKTKRTFVEMYDVDNFYRDIENNILTCKEGLNIEQPSLEELDIGGIYESDYFFC